MVIFSYFKSSLFKKIFFLNGRKITKNNIITTLTQYWIMLLVIILIKLCYSWQSYLYSPLYKLYEIDCFITRIFLMNEVIQLFEIHCRSITISIFHIQKKQHSIELNHQLVKIRLKKEKTLNLKKQTIFI